MTRGPNEKSLGNIDISLSDKIDKAVISRNNMKKKQFVEAAMEVFLAIPEHIQDQLLMRQPTSDSFRTILALLTKGLLDAETLKFLTSLSPQHRQTILADAKRAREKISRKKKGP